MSNKSKAQAFLAAHPGMTLDEAIDFLDKEIEKRSGEK
jgi:hypothetical protein